MGPLVAAAWSFAGNASAYVGSEALSLIKSEGMSRAKFFDNMNLIQNGLPLLGIWNDIAHGKIYGKAVNRNLATPPPENATRQQRDNYQPNGLELAQLVTAFNQGPWPRFELDNEAKQRLWKVLRDKLRNQGIHLAIPNNPDAIDSILDTSSPKAVEWYRWIDMSSAAAPLEDVTRAYYRGLSEPEGQRIVGQAELNFNLQRAQFRRGTDREVLLEGYHPWSPENARKLLWLGVITDDEFEALLHAAGVHRDGDRNWLELSSRLIPDIATLQEWSVRQLWDQNITDRYELDAGRNQSPIAQFFMRTQGARGQQPALPGQPEGLADWAQLGYRASRPLPDFGLAMEMQWRFRPDPADPAKSVDGSTPPWTSDNTRDMLKIAGYSPPIIDRMMGLTVQPINIRIAHTVLLETIKHPEVKALAEEAFGEGVDFGKELFLDHGFSESVAELASAAISAQADDAINAERIAHEARLRQANRDSYLKQYRLGTAEKNATIFGIRDKFFTLEMATQEVAIIDAEFENQIRATQLKVLHESFMTGKLTFGDVAATMTQIGIVEERKGQYLTEWTWERTEKTRMLATAEILSALKSGLLSVGVAQSRLVNLGWSSPDALIEIAQIERDLQMAAAKTAAAAATHQAAQAAKIHAEETKTAKENAISAAKESSKNVKVQAQLVNAVHQKLLAESKYYASAHADNAAYNTAKSKGNNEKMAAEIYKEVAAYQKYLLAQLQLVEQGPEVADEILPIDVTEAPAIKPSPGTGAPPKPA